MKNLKIIDTSKIEARIAELEHDKKHLYETEKMKDVCKGKIIILKEILQQAQDLQPVLENAFDKGQFTEEILPLKAKQEFIKNFKL